MFWRLRCEFKGLGLPVQSLGCAALRFGVPTVDTSQTGKHDIRKSQGLLWPQLQNLHPKPAEVGPSCLVKVEEQHCLM